MSITLPKIRVFGTSMNHYALLALVLVSCGKDPQAAAEHTEVIYVPVPVTAPSGQLSLTCPIVKCNCPKIVLKPKKGNEYDRD